MPLDKRYTLSGQAVRQLAADHDRLRGTPVRPAFSRGVVDVPPPEKQVILGLAEEEIGPAVLTPEPTFPSGDVRVYYLESDGTLGQSIEVLTAFNFLASTITLGSPVNLARDPWSKRWLIVGSPIAALAQWIYFEATESFTTADSEFTATILHYFDGADPRPTRWDSGGDGVIYNPPVNGGASFFFTGDNGAHGFALWHEDDAVTPGAPAGYWCEQLRCQT